MLALPFAWHAAMLGGFDLGRLIDRYPSASVAFVWMLAMVSYQQDVKHRTGFGILSQILATVCMIAIGVFGFTHRVWLNYILAPILLGVQIELTRRWKARPGGWW